MCLHTKAMCVLFPLLCPLWPLSNHVDPLWSPVAHNIDFTVVIPAPCGSTSVPCTRACSPSRVTFCASSFSEILSPLSCTVWNCVSPVPTCAIANPVRQSMNGHSVNAHYFCLCPVYCNCLCPQHYLRPLRLPALGSPSRLLNQVGEIRHTNRVWLFNPPPQMPAQHFLSSFTSVCFPLNPEAVNTVAEHCSELNWLTANSVCPWHHHKLSASNCRNVPVVTGH